ncbi:MAG: hypothetical protein A2V73_04880 [candidate division Zixibacteria bacterium RBG_19FT_COMBO_42_43]|nr:MAG: hypothetical protein A2V73_04880 [candidate division Zixibacteria bacterium RBG_19FT_COMBO_42_43]
MKVKKAILLLLTFLFNISVLAQVDTAWVRRYNGPGNGVDSATALAVDDSGNVYVTGGSYGNGTYLDYTTVKYAPNGNILWVRTYDGPASGDDIATSIKVDGKGNVYVTGSSDGQWGVTYFDYATIKYSSNGAILWVRRYNGPVNNRDLATTLAIDGKENVYVTGTSWGGITGDDYATIKYGPDGDTIWVRRYNGPGNSDDIATALTVDDSGNAYVTGISFDTITFGDIVTIKYSPNGDTLWLRRFDGPAHGSDIPWDLDIDRSGNVYVTGRTSDTVTLFDYVTLKYDLNGNLLWLKYHDGGLYGSSDESRALTVDDSGNVYVTGVVGSFPNTDYGTIKYAANGDVVWQRVYNGPWDNDEIAIALDVDVFGNVYVTGRSNLYLDYDYATLKYTPEGDTVWVRHYDGPANGNDFPSALKVDDKGNVYVVGSSSRLSYPSSYDYLTIKCIQFDCIALAGDATADNKILLPDIVTLINYLFKSQPAPNPFCRGDANADSNIQLSDIMYLINFIFKSGPAPVKNRECCL